jgi:hypothetical protein
MDDDQVLLLTRCRAIPALIDSPPPYHSKRERLFCFRVQAGTNIFLPMPILLALFNWFVMDFDVLIQEMLMRNRIGTMSTLVRSRTIRPVELLVIEELSLGPCHKGAIVTGILCRCSLVVEGSRFRIDGMP